MIFGLEKSVISAIQETFIKFPEVEKVIIYGSRAKGNYKKGSDIDLVLVGSGLNLTFSNKIENALDDLLLPYTFDISIYHHISNAELIDHIARVGRVFYEKQKSLF
jgi:predicted nucleotidyltransferase